MKMARLELRTASLDVQEQFYRQFNGLPVERSEDELLITLGATDLIFKPSNREYTYHFAINIPPKSIGQARTWLEEHGIERLLFRGEEIVEFPSWKARAVYFYDAAGNIVEWISRRDIGDRMDGSFFPQNLLHLSEIGLPVRGMERAVEKIRDSTGCDVYGGMGADFAALGNPRGLFILVNPDRKTWMPRADRILMSPWSLRAEVPKYPGGLCINYRDGALEYSKTKL